MGETSNEPAPQKSQEYQNTVPPIKQIPNNINQLDQILSNENKKLNNPEFNFREKDSCHYISINNTIADSYQRYNIPLDFDLYRIKLNFTEIELLVNMII